MKMFAQKLATPIMIAATALIMSACGGGGSGSSANIAPPPAVLAPAPTVITASNATPTAANAFSAAEALNNSANSSSNIVTGVTVSGTTPDISSAIVDVLAFTSTNRPAATVTGVTQTQNCPGGGTITLSGTVANQNTTTAGDNVTFSAASCTNNGTTLNGGFTIVINTLTGTIGQNSAWSTSLGVTFNNFSASNGSDLVYVAGDMGIGFAQTNINNRQFNIGGNSLQAKLFRSGTMVADRTLQNYAGTAALVSPNVTTSIGYTLSGSSTAAGPFSVTVKTLQPFVRQQGSYPSSGSLIVTGAASSVTLTALDNTKARLDFSAKGDGVITSTQTVTWVQLAASN